VICAYCRDELAREAALACTECATPLHGECASLHGRCVTFGCASTRFGEAPAEARRRLEPALPLWTRARRALHVEDAALVVFALAGVAALAWLR
jgi:hypothetical protein